MALSFNEYKQKVCNARALAKTINEVFDDADDGVTVTLTAVMRLANNDDVLILWREQEPEAILEDDNG